MESLEKITRREAAVETEVAFFEEEEEIDSQRMNKWMDRGWRARVVMGAMG